MQENRCLKLENEELIEELITALGKIEEQLKAINSNIRWATEGILFKELKY